MSLQVKLALSGDLNGFARDVHLRIARGARNAAEKHAARAKLLLRQDTRGPLGDRLANAWRADIYPKSASARTHAPAVQIYTKAPKIMEAFSQATTIVARNAKMLAIPTENVPRRGNKRLTPVEVEAQFNQDLIIKKSPSAHGVFLAFVNVIASKSRRGYRIATKRRRLQGRAPKLVLMFIFVKQVGLKKLLNWRQIFADLDRDWAVLFPQEINAALAD